MLSRGSLRLFRLVGIPVELHWSFWILPLAVVVPLWLEQPNLPWAILGPQLGFSLLTLFVAFVFVVLHELGHCLAAWSYGIQTQRITLLALGGIAQFERIPREPRQELWIVAAGPAVNFAAALLLWVALGFPDPRLGMYVRPTGRGLAEAALFFNLVMGLFNLLPILPMDGGRLLRALLALRWPFLSATRVALWVARPVAIALMVLALLNQQWLPAVLFGFILWIGQMEYLQARELARLDDWPIRELLRRPCLVAEAPEALVNLTPQLAALPGAYVLVADHDGRVVRIAQPAEVAAWLQDRPFTLLVELGAPAGRALPANATVGEVLDALQTDRAAFYPVEQEGQIQGVLAAADVQRVVDAQRPRRRVAT